MGQASRRARRRRQAPATSASPGPGTTRPSRHLERAVAAGLGAVAVTTYLLTLQRTVPGGDSGELIAVAYSLGTAHPPGYPLYTLLAKLFTLVPIGAIAWRVNLLSAVLDAAAAVVLCLAVTRWARSAWAGLAAGGLFAFSPLVWSNAVVAEVFALNNLFVALLIWLGVRYQERPDVRTAGWAALTLGLAASNHHTIVLLGAPYGLWLLLRGPASLRQPAQMARLAGLFALGLLPYVYLPLAASARPLMTWGDFSSVGGFVDHFLRRDYGTFQLGSGDHAQGQLITGIASFVREVPAQLLVVGPLLAVVGLVATLRREGAAGLGAVTACALVIYLLVFGSLANLAYDDALLYGVIARFWQQPIVVLCAWSGLGIAALAGWPGLRSPAIGTLGQAALAATLVALQLGVHYRHQDQHANTAVADYGRAILDSLPTDALLISLGDLDTNSIRYLQICEDLRPDVRVVDRALLRYDWSRPIVDARLPDVSLPPGPFSRRDDGNPATTGLTELIEANADRFPIFLSRLNEDEDQAWRDRFDVWPYGAVEWVVPQDTALDLDDYAAASDRARRALQSTARHDWPATTWEHYVWTRYRDAEFSRGLALLYRGIEARGDRRALELARSVFEDLARTHPEPPPALFKNIGLVYQHLSAFDHSYEQGMVDWWTRYLQVAPASDTEVAAIRALVESAAAGR